ncbi:MAG: SPOR domain-containing protein [Campylobacterales bacterium]|nr:SPOR domain-containing protein [Campylobacterales bacterium]
MKKLLFLFIFFSLFTALYAESLYVKVASVTRSDALFTLEYELGELGYRSYVAQHNEFYRVYAGPFKTQYDAKMALKEIQENISYDAYVTKIEVKNNKVYATPLTNDATPKPKEEVAEKAEKKVATVTVTTTAGSSVVTHSVESKNSVAIREEDVVSQSTQRQVESREQNMFIGVSFGASKFDLGTKGDLPLDIAMRSYGPNYGLEFGYYVNEHVFATLNYQRTDLRHSFFDAGFASLNYQLEKIGTANVYAGVLVGAAKLNWETSPVSGGSAPSSVYSVTGGFQVGTDVELYGPLSLYGYYRYMMMDFNTLVVSGTQSTEIDHSSQQDFNIGFKYHF